MTRIFSWLAGPQRPARLGAQSGSPDAQLNAPLIQIGKRDLWTIRDACEGTAIFGATGSGKTSGSGQALAKAFLNAGFGGLVLCAKRDEAELWRRYCAETNRSHSLVIFGPQQPHRFNFLNYELSRPGAGAGHTENLVRLFTGVMEVAERQRGQGNSQDFWQRTTKQMLRNCIDLVAIARGRLMLQDLYDVMVTAPSTPEEANSESWQNSSICWRCIGEGDAKPKNSRQEHDFAHAVKYWMREFPALSSRTRSIIVTSLTSMMDIFLRGALRELFCTSTTIVPEITHEGAVLVLDLSIKEYAEVGQLAQVLFKLVWQRACERRDVAQHPRPTFLWADEAQFFSTATDSDFQATARSSRILTVLLTQNIGMFNSQIGKEETNSLMGNLSTKFFHANGDSTTNNWAAELFAKSFQFRGSAGTSTSEGTAGNERVSRNYGTSDSIEFEVLPIEFSRLRKGGPENGWCVEAIAFQGGRIWNGSNKKNHIKVAFAQR